MTVTPLSTFSNVSEKTCAVSPDLTKLAEISETSDGSKVVGYLPTGGNFVNLSGHDSNSYSDTPITDENPMFNPTTGELWWTREKYMWSSDVSGGTPEDHGAGLLGAFTTAGEPLPYSVSTSPDGSIGAIEKPLEDLNGLGLAIGKSNALTASCQNRAGKGGNEIPAVITFVSQCPGVASIVLPEATCRFFTGFVSDSAFVCRTSDNGGERERFDRLAFKIEGHKVKIVSDITLTPPTQMKLEASVISPDGKTLWYFGIRNTSTSAPSEQASLYVIPTNTPTSEPAPVSLTPETALTATPQLAGWRWHGHLSSP